MEKDTGRVIPIESLVHEEPRTENFSIEQRYDAFVGLFGLAGKEKMTVWQIGKDRYLN